MKRSLSMVVSVAVSMAVVLAVGTTLMHRASGPPASPAICVSDAPPVLETEVPGPGTKVVEETRAAAPMVGNDSPAEIFRSDIAVLQEEVALLRTHITAFERWRHTQRRMPPIERPGSEADPAQAPRLDPRNPPIRAAMDRERQQQMTVIEAGFRREPADPRWATETEGVVQEALARDTLIQNTLLGLECRSQTCRVELADDNTGELMKEIPLVLMQLGSTLPNAKAHASVDSTGGKTMILYLTQGTPALPPPGR